MNIYSLIGLILASIVLVTGLFLSTNDISIFIDYPSMFIVIGGTLAATAISFQIDKLGILLKVFFNRIIRGKKTNYAIIIKELVTISEEYRKGSDLASLMNDNQDRFLTEALTLASDKILEGEELFELLELRSSNINDRYMDEANKFKNVGKYPPAFGMMGTTIGMIVLLANLGGADAMKRIGPAMGVCLITTLYGVIISNLAIIPIAENLVESTREIQLKNKIIIEGLRLIMQKTNPIILTEYLNSFVNPKHRIDWKEVVK